MAEFLTMDEAKSKFGTKGRTNAGLTLGIIGTALAAFAGNNGRCGCGNGGGILGNLFGGNNNCCAMQAAENAKTLAMAKQTYEAGFMSFLGTKFSQEFVSSADGKVAADNLLATIRKSKEHIHAQLKAKEDKVNTLLELVEQDPEIKKRLDEVMLSKSK